MKCPKCGFVSFDKLETCKRCKHVFAIEEPVPKHSFLAKMKDILKKEDEKTVSQKEVKEQEPEPAPQEVVPAPKEEVSAAQAKAAVATASLVDSFDDKFDDLFGEDKYAVKESESDAIKLTAVDRYTQQQTKPDNTAANGYNFDDSFFKVTGTSEEEADEMLQEDNVEEPLVEKKEEESAFKGGQEFHEVLSDDVDADDDLIDFEIDDDEKKN